MHKKKHKFGTEQRIATDLCLCENSLGCSRNDRHHPRIWLVHHECCLLHFDILSSQYHQVKDNSPGSVGRRIPEKVTHDIGMIPHIEQIHLHGATLHWQSCCDATDRETQFAVTSASYRIFDDRLGTLMYGC